MPHTIFDDEVLARIVAAAGRDPHRISLDDLRALLLQINGYWAVWEGARGHAQARKKAIRARDASWTLLTLLRDDEILRMEAPDLLPCLEVFYNRIDPKKLAIEASEIIRNTKKRLGMRGRPLDTLVDWLRQSYEDIFGEHATSWRPPDGSPPDTPFVGFAHQATIESGIKCTRLTIHSAYERNRRRQHTAE
jgi:hypothetical protein